jgi:tetratricopeptide (TPR) repeat protein
MLSPKKKISKRELKEDALVTSYVKVTSFYERNKKNISIAVTVVVVLIIASVVFLKNRADNSEKASSQLGEVFSLYDNGQYQQAIDGLPERNITGLKSIVDNYGSLRAGNYARFYLANAYFHLGKYDLSLEQFEDFSPTEDVLAVSRLAGIGSCYEAMGKYKEAAENYEKAGAKYPQDVNAAENLSNAARAYGRAGEKETAIELYKKVKKNYPTSPFARDADRYIAGLAV